MGTSQAVDIISGGAKGTSSHSVLIVVNALPESVYAIVNHRISMGSSVKQVQNHLTELLTPLINSIPATFIAFDKHISSLAPSENPQNTTVTLSLSGDAINPAPASPVTSHAWRLLARTVKEVFGQQVVLAPSLMTGNTDTKYYWELCNDIWRFTPIWEGGRGNAHTVDEFVGIRDHVRTFEFYVQLIRGAEYM